MKLVKLSTIALVSVIGLTAAAQVSQAADPTTSTATVKLTPEDDESKHTATNPIVPGTPDGDKTGHIGPLTIDVRPFLQFGEAKLVSGKTILPIANTYNTNVQVTDSRAKGAGWDLQVAISEFKDAATSKTLSGAQLTLGFKELQTTNATQNNAPTPAVSVAVNDQPQSLLSAAAGSGLGTWAYLFDQTKVEPKSKLEILSGNYVGDYSATITWTLSDTPK